MYDIQIRDVYVHVKHKHMKQLEFYIEFYKFMVKYETVPVYGQINLHIIPFWLVDLQKWSR